MERKKIHQDGPEFSRILTGAWRWDSLSPDQISNLVETSLQAGITSFDHADIYGDYACEELFGNVLRSRPDIRQHIQLVSKCGIKLLSAKKPGHWIKHYDTTKKHIVESAEQSLKNLGTDYLDLLLLHRPDPLLNPTEVAAAFDSLKRSGKVLHFGVSNFTPSQFEMLQAHLNVTLVTNQVEVSLFKPELLSDGTIDTLMKHNVCPMVWSPLGGGNFFNTQSDATLNEMNTLAEKYTCTISQLAIAWLVKHPSGMLPILGSTSPQRIKEGVQAASLQIDLQDWFYLLKLSTGRDVA